jgi:hypothetical protein
MPGGPATILGGLPVWAEVSFYKGDGWTTDDDADVDGLFWLKRDGTKGAPISQKVMDRVEKEPYWECDVIESVSEHLAHEQYEREQLEKARVLAGGRVDYNAVKAAWDKISEGCVLSGS